MGDLVSLSVIRGRRGKPHIFKFAAVWVQLSFGKVNGAPTGSMLAANSMAGPYQDCNPVGALMVTNYLHERGLLQRMVNMIAERTP